MNILRVIFVFPFIILAAISLNLKMGKPGSGQTRFERFDGTCGKHNLPWVVHYINIRTASTKAYVNLSFTVTEDVLDCAFMLHFEKCKNAENMDTCEPFIDMHEKSFHAFLQNRNPVSDFMKAFQPELKCPIKKNFYSTNDTAVDFLLLVMIPLQPEYWKMRVELKQKDKLLCCFIAETHIYATL